jgi:hypothetical protein
MHDARVREAAARGPEDPLGQIGRTISLLRRQAWASIAAAAASAGAAGLDRRAGVAGALAGVGCAALLAAAACVLAAVRRCRIHDMILARTRVECGAFARELERLGGRSNRERLATALERALADGRRWSELLPASRPPPGARDLPANAAAILTIAGALRAGRASPRAIVMLERLMRGGYGSALYEGRPAWLRQELGRIRFEIESGT